MPHGSPHVLEHREEERKKRRVPRRKRLISSFLIPLSHAMDIKLSHPSS
jgi:hypothetical protein